MIEFQFQIEDVVRMEEPVLELFEPRNQVLWKLFSNFSGSSSKASANFLPSLCLKNLYLISIAL